MKKGELKKEQSLPVLFRYSVIHQAELTVTM
jgi:hypothetical protein